MAPKDLTREDLEHYQRQAEVSNEKLVGVLKEVAQQFSTIAAQLLSLTKGIDELHKEQQHKHDSMKASITSDLANMLSTFSASCRTCHDGIKQCEAQISEAAKELYQRHRDTDAKVGNVTKQLDDMDKDHIKSRTLYTVIVGAFVGAATLVGVIIKSPSCYPPPSKEVQIKYVPVGELPRLQEKAREAK